MQQFISDDNLTESLTRVLNWVPTPVSDQELVFEEDPHGILGVGGPA